MASVPLLAQQSAQDAAKNRVNPDSSGSQGSGLVLPILYYSPETQTGGGIIGIYYFRLPGSTPATRPSNLKGDIVYTQRNQFFLQLLPQLYLQNEKFFIDSEFSYIRFTDKFWGIGNNTPFSAEEPYSNDIRRFRLSLLRRLPPVVNFGFQLHYESFKMNEVTEFGQLNTNAAITGADGSTVAGFGLIFNFDSRDNFFAAHDGSFYQFSTMLYSRTLGGNTSYIQYTIDARKYISMMPNHVIATQFYANIINGSPPFQLLSRLGGNVRMRGYFEGRFRDNDMITLQTEYRFPIAWRFSAATFGAVGDVANSFRDFALQKLKFSYGFGIRFAIKPEERIVGRLDFGFGNGTRGVYVSVNEAF
jgi:hypothetical protein